MSDRILIVMGVSGSGKTTIAEHLAARLGWPFQEGDMLHPAANVAKMRRGEPLTDEDRAPWLAIVAEWVDARLATGAPGIITCSALKRSYRDVIAGNRPGVRLIYLHGDRGVLEQHVQGRHHEFMPPTLLDSQLETLEEPGEDEHAVQVDVAGTADQTVAAILGQLDLPPAR
jgi:carbohydrate kinase (thermoresistant glucokinase family)